MARQTAAPESGPKLNDAISAGSSEKSIVIKLGINGSFSPSLISTIDSAAIRSLLTKIKQAGRFSLQKPPGYVLPHLLF